MQASMTAKIAWLKRDKSETHVEDLHNTTYLTTFGLLGDNSLPSFSNSLWHFPSSSHSPALKEPHSEQTHICGTSQDRYNYLLKELCKLGTRRSIGVSDGENRAPLYSCQQIIAFLDMHHYAFYIKRDISCAQIDLHLHSVVEG